MKGLNALNTKKESPSLNYVVKQKSNKQNLQKFREAVNLFGEKNSRGFAFLAVTKSRKQGNAFNVIQTIKNMNLVEFHVVFDDMLDNTPELIELFYVVSLDKMLKKDAAKGLKILVEFLKYHPNISVEVNPVLDNNQKMRQEILDKAIH